MSTADPYQRSRLLNAETSVWTTSDHLLTFGAFSRPSVSYIANIFSNSSELYEIDNFGYVNILTHDENAKLIVVNRVVQVIRHWLGLSPNPPTDGAFTKTELIYLKLRAKRMFLTRACDSIRDLNNIVSQMSQLELKLSIADQVNEALLWTRMSLNEFENLNESLRLARMAAIAATESLNDKSISSDPHFSIEYTFALYAPFGLPIAVPVVSGIIKYLKRRRV
jgi:hypothetical protein